MKKITGNNMEKTVKYLSERAGKFVMAITVGLCCTAPAAAQESVSMSFGADVVSQYIWRGQDLGGLSLQPGLDVSFKGVTLSAWGSTGISVPADTRELDLTLSYSAGGLNVGLTDYYFDSGQDPFGRYFRYSAHGTNHVFELNAGYDFGVAGVQWYTNIGGNDGTDADGDRAYSSYFELSVPFCVQGLECTAALGAVPFETSFYGTSGFAVTNVSMTASGSVNVTDSFSLPLFAGVVANPRTEMAYLVFGLTLRP